METNNAIYAPYKGNYKYQRKFYKDTIVKHFKYDSLTEEEKNDNKYLYRIKGTGIDSETKEKVMIYQALYYPFDTYVRPYDMFMSEVDKEKYPNVEQVYRFETCYGEEHYKALERCREIRDNINDLLNERNDND